MHTHGPGIGQVEQDFHDADQDLPDAFRKAMERGGGVTEEMREEFTAILIATIARLASAHRDVCLCQALVRNRLRERILAAVPAVILQFSGRQ